MKANIVTIGNEILIGQIADTNAHFISQQLDKIGFTVHRIITISDNREDIYNVIHESFLSVDVILMTGGLGPTNDDITKHTLNEFFNGKLVNHQPTLEHITGFFKQRGMELTDTNRKQAMVPDCCEVIPNDLGTAPGMWFKKNGKILVSMPGVQYEMKNIMTGFILTKLKQTFKLPFIVHKNVLTQGIAESVLADMLQDWEGSLPESIKVAYLPTPGIVKLRLSAYGENIDNINSTVSLEVSKLNNLIKDYIFGYDDESLESIIGKILTNKGKTVSTAESCSGGSVAAAITSVPGSSLYFKGGMVSYGNMVKIENLQVKGEDILNFGAVSEEVVEQMAKGAIKLFKTDYAIATSGIAGPTGGTPEKPVGTIWIAVASKDIVISKKYQFGDDRGRNITKTVYTALNMLRKLITGIIIV